MIYMKNTFLKLVCSLATIALFAGSLYVSITAYAQDDFVEGTEASVVADRFIGEISLLGSVKLDPKVFSNPVFKDLEDFSRPLPDEAKGRTNPFAPIN